MTKIKITEKSTKNSENTVLVRIISDLSIHECERNQKLGIEKATEKAMKNSRKIRINAPLSTEELILNGQKH